MLEMASGVVPKSLVISSRDNDSMESASISDGVKLFKSGKPSVSLFFSKDSKSNEYSNRSLDIESLALDTPMARTWFCASMSAIFCFKSLHFCFSLRAVWKE